MTVSQTFVIRGSRDVVLIDPNPNPLEKVLGPEVGAVIRQLHNDHGSGNISDVHDDIEQLIRSGKQVSVETLTDPDIPLNELAEAGDAQVRRSLTQHCPSVGWR